MSRISDLENKVDVLERNVGVLAKSAGIEDWIKFGDYSSISHYNAGIKDAPEEDEGKTQECIEELVDEVNRCYEIIDRLIEYIDVLKKVNNPLKLVNSAIVKDLHDIAVVVNQTKIYEYDGTAIYDLHMPITLSYIWKTHMFVGGGVLREMTVADIKKFFEENPSFAGQLNVVQDINHMSDIYLIP